jgi:hypothetical protein
MRSALKDDNLGKLLEPAQAGSGTGASSDTAHN